MEHVAEDPALLQAREYQEAERQAAARKLAVLVAYRARLRYEAQATGLPTLARAEAEKAAVRHAALALGYSEWTMTQMLNTAEYSQDELPRTWAAFLSGVVDMPRLREIATTASGMLTAEHRAVVDQAAAQHAGSVNPGELQSWLNRTVASLGEAEYARRCEKAYESRYVRIVHGDDGMSDIEARIPTLAAAQIQKHLYAAAHSARATVPVPDRAGLRLGRTVRQPVRRTVGWSVRRLVGPCWRAAPETPGP
ncbi:DUF222 domain-containing protein [Nesterenkonia flava]|uniref:DUF222 domain-containing protein n=1 Tax=Nesterenkonia flava TaxID=469799 RepID=A0ABU1FVE7_9MICC|nr:DUF222 domain-containing protein [Nesterenkonia flava]MDR5712647.1 DUF222 domain-containing protein [Nesterenkonia flava]